MNRVFVWVRWWWWIWCESNPSATYDKQQQFTSALVSVRIETIIVTTQGIGAVQQQLKGEKKNKGKIDIKHVDIIPTEDFPHSPMANFTFWLCSNSFPPHAFFFRGICFCLHLKSCNQ